MAHKGARTNKIAGTVPYWHGAWIERRGGDCVENLRTGRADGVGACNGRTSRNIHAARHACDRRLGQLQRGGEARPAHPFRRHGDLRHRADQQPHGTRKKRRAGRSDPAKPQGRFRSRAPHRSRAGRTYPHRSRLCRRCRARRHARDPHQEDHARHSVCL